MNYIFVKNLHELTEKLAYEYWEHRGRPLGSPEIDWSSGFSPQLADIRKTTFPCAASGLSPMKGHIAPCRSDLLELSRADCEMQEAHGGRILAIHSGSSRMKMVLYAGRLSRGGPN